MPYSDSVRILLLDLLIQRALDDNYEMKKTDVPYFSVNPNDT